MEIELEARVKPLAYKVKAMSRESPSQKAAHVLDTDLRTHWSTATNTKEWILMELNVIHSTLTISLFLFLSHHSHFPLPRSVFTISFLAPGTLLAISYQDLQQVRARMGNFCWLTFQGLLLLIYFAFLPSIIGILFSFPIATC